MATLDLKQNELEGDREKLLAWQTVPLTLIAQLLSQVISIYLSQYVFRFFYKLYLLQLQLFLLL